ncbi:hypothetical protein B0H14DRAFT_3157074 [Mycena olivaceomarginata]|nr:hypothetical protein B0H14DRAFT_3157074 [Mycena olivaceomarginata]
MNQPQSPLSGNIQGIKKQKLRCPRFNGGILLKRSEVGVMNHLKYALFATPLIRLSEVRPLRMTWFCKFVHQSSAHPVSLPLFVNHNFPQLGPEDFFEAEIPQAVATLSKSYMPPLPPSAAGEPAHGSPKSKSPSTLSDTILPTVHHLTLNKPNITPNSSEGKRKLQDQKEHDDDSDSDAGDQTEKGKRVELLLSLITPSRKEKDASATLARLLGIENSADDSEEEEEEDEEDYEEPEGTSSKKRKPKPPRGASKKQKEAAAEKQKVQRTKKKTAGGNRTVRAAAMAARGRKEKK